MNTKTAASKLGGSFATDRLSLLSVVCRLFSMPIRLSFAPSMQKNPVSSD